VHQWAKNLLVFVPVAAAHRLADPALAARSALAFAALCLCASSAYVFNDLVDLPADRLHPTKSRRPLPAGDVGLGAGLAVSALCLAGGFALSLLLPGRYTAGLAAYWAATLAYSLWLKRHAPVDVLVLAGLYTLRIVSGTLATGVPSSSWLLTLSMFLFLSLAFVKRTTELLRLREKGGARPAAAAGRGYSADDQELVTGMGMASGLVAVLVLALYLSSADVARLYAHHARLWLLCPLALYWVNRVWLLARRGLVHDDPVAFTLKDPASYVTGALALGVLWLGA
jgi:4-hydroxybenzoate polyprenyltransferase